jgi:hypothetical protein
MSKTTTTKAAPDRAATFKTIAGRVRLIGSRRAPATRAIYNEVAAMIEKEAKKHAAKTTN